MDLHLNLPMKQSKTIAPEIFTAIRMLTITQVIT